MKVFSFGIILLVLLLFSCTVQRELPNNYLHNNTDTSVKNLAKMADPVIQKNDLLSIRVVSSSTKPETDVPYNLHEQINTGGLNNPASGFLVESDGAIQYPQLGTIYVEGMTRGQVAQTIKSKLSEKLTDPIVIVRFVNYKVTVLGEVQAPGTFNLPTERITILEALGLAGDVTEFGSRRNVQIAREVNGKVEIGNVDLTSGDLFDSPYYHLKQNDVVMVEQTGRRFSDRKEQRTVQQIGIATSVISTIAIIFSVFR